MKTKVQQNAIEEYNAEQDVAPQSATRHESNFF